MAGEHTSGSSGGMAATGMATGARALDAAMTSTTAFTPQAGAMVMRASERHIDRMVPERDATRRSRPLAALEFSDRVLGPYVRRAQQSPLRMFGGADAPGEAEGGRELEIEPTSWVFPRPWYVDELAWLQSVRMSASAESGPARSAWTTSMQAAVARGAGAGGLSAIARSATAAPAVALDFVAPSFGRAGMSDARQRATMAAAPTSSPSSGRSVAGQSALVAQPTVLRAWSPLVPFPAVQAAELMAGVLAPASRAGDASEDTLWQEARPAPAQELVAPFTPRELAASRADRTVPMAQRSGREAKPFTRPESSAAGDVPEALRNRLQNALRRLEAQRGQVRAAARAPGQPAAAPAAARTGVSGTSTSPAGAPAAESGPVVSTSAGVAAPAAPVPARERALELMLHSALAGRSGMDMAPVTGPRLALPAGLGGLIAGLRAARTLARPVSSRQNIASAAVAAAEMRPPIAPTSAMVASGAAGVQTRPAELPLLGGAPGAITFGQTSQAAERASGASYGSAYRAVMQTRPAALVHIAWSDRWLARFAGASAEALAVLEATTSAAVNTQASRAFSSQAPEPVFLSASLGERETRAGSAAAGAPAPAAMRAGRAAPPAERTVTPAPQVAAASQRPGASLGASALGAAPRIADDAAVPDEVFAAIAAARAPRRPAQPARSGDAGVASTGQSRAQAGTSSVASRKPAVEAAARAGEAQPTTTGPDFDQVTGSPANHVDRLLAASPAAPGPGMRVALASSPVAPVLSALLTLPPSPSFDVRAMHGVELASAYLAGVIEPGGVANAARAWPMLSPLRWEQGAAAPMQIEPSAAGSGLWTDLPMVAPAAASAAPGASAEASRSAAAQPLTPGAAPAGSVPVAAGAATGTGNSVAEMSAAAHRAVLVQDRGRSAGGPGLLLPAAQPVSAGAAFSWGTTPEAANRAAPRQASSESRGTGSAVTPVALAAALPAAAAFTYGPGSAAAQAESWAMMREQHAADLSLDYVSPELLVAAQAYGFGPAEAAQAARLSSSGRTGLAALAAAVDLRFIDAFATARSGEWPAASAPSPSSSGARLPSSVGSISAWSGVAPDVASRIAPGSSANPPAVLASAASSSIATSAPARDAAPPAASGVAITAAGASVPVVPGTAPTPGASMRSLGMPVRTPRGAFLWPQATIMAMNLQLAEADSAQPLSLAALDLLAANAVAQMGVLVAPEQASAAAIQQAGARSSGAVMRSGVQPAASAGTLPATAAGQGQSARAIALRAGFGSATPLAPDVLAATQGSALAAGAPPATYITPVLDIDLGPDLGRPPAMTSAAAGTIATGPGASGSRTAMTGLGAVPGPAVQESTTDTPVAAAAALGHHSSLPAGFEALYVALSQSPAGRSQSPAVRAARALALAGSFVARTSGSRGGASPTNPGTRARAAAAWAVMPTVLTGYADTSMTAAADPGAFAGASAPDMPTLHGVDQPRAEQPERQLMMARAGESLQSFVAPGEASPQLGNRAASTPASSAPSRSRGAMHRVPTAAQPLVQTAQSRANVVAVQEMMRSAQQKRASGDKSIPAWFEEAARRMFQDGSDGGGISLAEMTLVTAAPARLVAASPKSASSSASMQAPNPTGGSESHDVELTANVEQLARDVYAEICRMIEFMRNRNGDTWR